MIPTVGRIVHVHLYGDESGKPAVFAGVVTGTYDGSEAVDVSVFQPKVSTPLALTSVSPDCGQGVAGSWLWSWPPKV